MLEAIRERAQGWIAKVILILIVVPFALWGIESYFSGGGGDDWVAKVGDVKISRQQFGNVLQDEIERLRQAQGPAFDAAQTRTPQFRRQVLDGLVERDALIQAAQKAGLVATDAQIASIIAKVPAFQENGKFSRKLYEQLLAARGITPAQFENQLRRDILVETWQSPIVVGEWVPPVLTARMAALLAQQREVSWVDVKASDFAKQSTPTGAEAAAYYRAHPQDYTLPAAVKVHYLVFSPAALAQNIQPTDAQIQQYYQDHQAQYTQPEEREASHILIAVSGDDPKQWAAAKAKAEQILAQVRKNPADFAAQAKRYSQDPGSAANGGNLGFFARDAMVKPFADAVFAMQKPGEIVGPVKTPFGYHIIQLDAIRPAQTLPLAQVRDVIATALRQREAQSRFDREADDFSDKVYEEGKALAPVAKRYGLSVQATDWITRADAPAPLNNTKLLDAVFAAGSLKSRQNTEAVDVGNHTLVAARVLDYRAPQLQPLSAVQDAIAQKLTAQKEAQLAQQEDVKLLGQLRQGREPADTRWTPFKLLDRQQMTQQLADASAVSQVFRMPADKLPAYTSYALPDGSRRIVRLTRVITPADISPDLRSAVAAGLKQSYVRADMDAAAALVKAEEKVQIRKNALEQTGSE